LFLAFRFSLFFFIIFFPCIRGIRVWFAAGGRIRLRRTGGVDEDGNSRGFIFGLRYQSADLDRWLILSGYGPSGVHHPNGGGTGSASNGMARKLTVDEVYALPEIDAPSRSDDDETGTGTKIGDALEIGLGIDDKDELAATHHGNNHTINTISDNNSNDNDNDNDNDNSSSNNDNNDNDNSDLNAASPDTESEPPSTPPATQTLFTTTMSTICSICIDDFEEDEKIRLLPRCGHAFHTECILPWLTERQGCCPCCKAPVIVEEEAKDDEENQDVQNLGFHNMGFQGGEGDRFSNINRSRTRGNVGNVRANPILYDW